MFNQMYHIIKKELVLEIREKYRFLSSIIYLVAICFVIYKVFGSLEGPTKMALFWLIFLFTAINIVGESFSFQGQKRKLNYYQLYDPVALFLGKLFFSLIKLILAGLILIGLQTMLSGQPLLGPVMFFKAFLLSAVGLGVILNLISAISAYSDNQNVLVSIMSLPVVIPILLLAMRVSLISERFFVDTAVDRYLLMIGGIDLLLLSLSLIFIPLIWKS